MAGERRAAAICERHGIEAPFTLEKENGPEDGGIGEQAKAQSVLEVIRIFTESLSAEEKNF